MAFPTALLERDRPRPGASGSGAPVAPEAERKPAGQLRLVLFAAATTTLALLFRHGYSFGMWDQTVYSLRGIALADPTALRSDWFAQTVPQPHWLFDVLTYLGARFGVLPGVYLAYWVAGILAFAVGSVWLTRRFLPDRPALATVLGPLVVLGPAAVLGSTTPLLGFADPHMLGGCLAFLALCGLLTDRWRAASLAALAAGLFHVQHGANLAPVLILTAVLANREPTRRRLLLVGMALVLVIGAAGTAQWRDLQTTGDQWLITCRRLIPFHCYAPSWGPAYLAAGAVVLAAALGFAWSTRRQWRSVFPVVALPAVGLLLGILVERFELGVLGRLAAQFNVHRLATIVEPFAAFGILCLVAGAAGCGRTRLGRVGAAVVALAVWSTMSGSAVRGHRVAAALVVVGLTVGLLAWFVPRHASRPRPRAAALLACLVIVTVAAASHGYLGQVGFDRSLPAVRAALGIKAVVPDTGLIAAPPDLYWLRAISERSVVVDCKAVPYGGPLFDEYMARMQDLGGNCVEGRSFGWPKLSVEALESVRAKYGVTHVLLYENDPKVAYARAHWRQVFSAPAEDFEFFEHGMLLFDTTGSA